MTVTYQQLLRDTAIRLSALVGSQKTTITATYDTATLTDAHFKSADWPFGAFRDAILMAEEDFAWAVADTANHPWRSGILSTTSSLADASNLPPVETGGRRIIGVLGAVYDATDGTECLQGELDEIMRVRRLQTAGVLTLPVYLYRLDGQRIRHTRTNVVIEVCYFDREVRLAAFNTNLNMLLSDVLEFPIVARAVSILTKETAFADQAAVYDRYATSALMRIRDGLTSVGNKAIPISAGESA